MKEGISLNLADMAKPVSEKLLLTFWRRVSDKSLPDVYAFTFEDANFYFGRGLSAKKQRRYRHPTKEYGVDFDDGFVDACTFEFKGHLIVFVKESAPLEECLEHEFRHVKDWKFQANQ
jgi:hypothetical protein